MPTWAVNDALEYQTILLPIAVKSGIVLPKQAVWLVVVGAFGNAYISKVDVVAKLSQPFASVTTHQCHPIIVGVMVWVTSPVLHSSVFI